MFNLSPSLPHFSLLPRTLKKKNMITGVRIVHPRITFRFWATEYHWTLDIGKKEGCAFAATRKDGNQVGIVLMQVPLLLYEYKGTWERLNCLCSGSENWGIEWKEEIANQAEDIKTCPGKQEGRTIFGFSITIVFTRLSPDFSKISLNETLASKQSKKQK